MPPPAAPLSPCPKHEAGKSHHFGVPVLWNHSPIAGYIPSVSNRMRAVVDVRGSALPVHAELRFDTCTPVRVDFMARPRASAAARRASANGTWARYPRPLLDRIDVHIVRSPFNELRGKDDAVSSAHICERVVSSLSVQQSPPDSQTLRSVRGFSVLVR